LALRLRLLLLLLLLLLLPLLLFWAWAAAAAAHAEVTSSQWPLGAFSMGTILVPSGQTIWSSFPGGTITKWPKRVPK